jgi:hypothetical protein
MIRAVIACGGREGIYPCRQATPVGVVDTGADASPRDDGWPPS